MTTPIIPPPGSTGPIPGQDASGPVPPMPADTSDPWYAYAQQMFPNAEITPEIIAGLKKNMMTMIGTTISEINARHAIANKYNQDVAQGNE